MLHVCGAVSAAPGTGKSQGMARAFVNGRAELQFDNVISCYHDGREIARMAAGMTFLKRGSENPRARAHVMYSCTAGHARKRFTETNLKFLQSIMGQLTLIWGHHC